MLRNFLQLLKTFPTRTPQSLWKIAKLVGLRVTKNLSPYSLEVRFQNGMYQKFVLLGRDLRPLVGELRGQDLLKISSNSHLTLLKEQQGENLHLSNATILSARLRKLSWWEESVDLLLLAYPISQMKGCEMRSQVLGGTRTPKEPSRTTRSRIKRNRK